MAGIRVSMQSCVPDIVCTLQKYGKKRSLECASSLHGHICENGLDGHQTIGNHIVPMLVACGNISNAHEAFHSLVYRDEHSWTSLIKGYMETGQLRDAFNLYRKMQEDDVHPSCYTFTALLGACARTNDIERGRKFHAKIRENGLESDVFIGSALVDMYAKCGSLLEAQEVFDKLPHRNVVSWTALINGYANYGSGQDAVKCFEQMQLGGVFPNAATFVCVLKACSNIGAIDKGRELHMEIAERGLDRDILVGNVLIDMYAKHGLLSEAREVILLLPVRNVVSWTTLIAGYVENGVGFEALKCFEEMQTDGISPNPVTFIYCLKACSSIRSIDEGRKIRKKIQEKGYEKDVFVGSALIDMYIKCGSLDDARMTFDKLPCRGVVTWTTMISGYAENGLGQDALKCYEEMHLEGISPNAITFICCLKACNSLGVHKGREIHSEVIKKGFQCAPSIGNTLIDMYCKCGSIIEAREVFNMLPVRDVVSWNALIAGYAENGHALEALESFELMQFEGVCPNIVTFICSLKACGSIGAVEKGRKIHIKLEQDKFEYDLILGNTLIDMYARCGHLVEAREVIDKLPKRDVLSWNTMLAAYAENGLGKEALECFECMRMAGNSPNAITFVCVLKSCSSIGAIDKGREMHIEIKKLAIERDLFVANTLIDMYAKSGSLVEALEVFENLPVRDVVSWNALISGYVEQGFCSRALEYFDRMKLCAVSANAVTFICSLKACGTLKAIDKAREIHASITKRGLERDVLVANALIDVYAKCASLAEAQGVFGYLPNRDAVSWTTMIVGYAEHGYGQKALQFFEQMQLEGLSPDPFTFASCLKACGSIGAIEKGRELHYQVTKKGMDKETFVGTALVDMYAKGGFLPEARGVFDRLPQLNIVTWNAMIGGYSMNDETDMAIECFSGMQVRGIKPDVVTFMCLLTACSRAGLVAQGQEYFEMMRGDYRIEPTRDHYNSMVDIFSRSGCLYEAEKLLQTTPYPLCEEAWTAFLSACKSYGEMDLGLKCFQRLVQMNSGNAVPYVLMANIYAGAGMWVDANRTEELRKLSGAKKKPGRVLIEVNKEMHEFVVGDHQTDEISAMLETLASRIKEEGHVPNLDVVLKPVSDAEKEIALCGHAEKLAIAFGLLHTPQGQTLRMSKNLRMCTDCHSASKVISKIERREIILRESKWTHHFRDGLCSCGDMW